MDAKIVKVQQRKLKMQRFKNLGSLNVVTMQDRIDAIKEVLKLKRKVSAIEKLKKCTNEAEEQMFSWTQLIPEKLVNAVSNIGFRL